MKKYLFIATALAALASCSDDTFVGETSPNEANGNGAISFNSSSRAITRSDGTTADKLNNNFVVFGYKTVSDNASTVFNNYQVNWVTNTAGTTESNSANWEYVSYKNLPFGTTTASGETLNDRGVQYNATTSTTNIEQSIKYWDFSARAYDFFAYSLGTGVDDNDDEGEENQYAKASAMSTSPDTYTLEGTAAQLGTCYISNKNTVVPSASATEVDLEFRSFLSQIQLMFYETIP
ncbi:MAG: membrane lipoprotein lipid attachment site-containing protein, partial [Bacteroidaceae bacterium]|nr:membrane lipoprotein lipid attachment site-containing protein [Bacteroidaceae bacterium]